MRGTDPAPRPLLTPDQLPDDPATLKQMIVELLVSLQERDQDNAALRHRLDLLLRRLYGPRGERFDPNQLLLFTPSDTDTATSAAADPADPPTRRRCRPHGRRRLPENLPRDSRHHELPEAARLCPACGQARRDIGVDRSEQLEYRPASLFVVEHIVHKYACPCCSRTAVAERDSTGAPKGEAEPMPVPQPQPPAGPAPADPALATTEAVNTEQGSPLTASAAAPPPGLTPPAVAAPAADGVVIAAVKPASPIAKGLPGPGLLAHLIVSKYTDHLPLYRLERIYERQGVLLPRSTLCDWLAASAALLGPLYQEMVRVVLQSRALHTDDTTVKMQDPLTHQLSTARLWVYLGDAAHPYNVFDFTVNRRRDGPEQFLTNYQGYLHADAFAGYDGLYVPDPRTAAARIVEVACNAHARRKFYEARGGDGLRAHQALAYYGQLYELERAARDFSEEQRLHMRQDLARPILEQMHTWLQEQRAAVLPKSPMAEALGYALNNWTALVRYTEAGYLAIDNNVAEREMKRVAIGRKNWLFVGSAPGGRTAAVLLSFTSTCQRLGVEPWAYLQDVLTRLPMRAADDLGLLLPDRWQAARSSPS